MKLSLEEVKHVASLARLKLEPAEEELFRGQLSQVLDFINTLGELDTSSVEPMSHALDVKNVFREDRQEDRFDKQLWKANAPSQDYGHFRVPKIIEG
ncbi:MAG: Asp-tRNA(Asn)/Glu-tRNA(Gln) amidotransferase subunit GatC [Nitrospinota bacterium]|nr:Asp-tRNA(Asn)/Glu-tRNA(Gln) amidotransferase subunit GatC [Nitrospinota bacterium]